MSTIKDILKVDLSVDIKTVIDLEDQEELEIQKEIESYIVTDKIADHLSKFIKLYTSNISETGVWISGFYGSGKSYFGKMLGYLLANHIINGTPARERFIPRLAGVRNHELLVNDINRLDSISSKVVLLDMAKQSSDYSLSYLLFINFLKTLGFLPTMYGFIEYEIFLDGRYDEFLERIQQNEIEPWQKIKRRDMKVPQVLKKNLTGWYYNDVSEYEATEKYIQSRAREFDPFQLREKIEEYLKVYPDDTIAFILDEASEAIAQQKYSLLELEGISEALTSVSKKVWTIAIAQERLDDVINNNNVSRSQLVKVTDRFKTKIHLESTDVDKIIQSRLLKKKESSQQSLMDYYQVNGGLITDGTNLQSNYPTITENAEKFSIYYPFHEYQFRLLQEFLFSSKALTSTQIAARGMIITTFDVLRKQLKDKPLYMFATAYNLTSEAQTQPPVDLVAKYDAASKILNSQNSQINGEHLLKTIHFTTESRYVLPTVENITKLFISDLATYYQAKTEIESALQYLTEARIVLQSNNQYKITSDLETRLLEEMNDFPVDLHIKKRDIINKLKQNQNLRAIQSVQDGQSTYSFHIVTDTDDEIIASAIKQMKLVVYNIYNIHDNFSDFIEHLKVQTQNDKDKIYLVPQVSDYEQINKLIEEVKRYSYIIDRYSGDNDDNTRQIIREFNIIRDQREKALDLLLQKAYTNGRIVYLFDDSILGTDAFKSTIQSVQKKVIKNIFTKRLENQLSEDIAPKILKETMKDRLHRFFAGDDFKYFDTNGNFIGEHLSVVEEVTRLIQKSYVDGQTLENELQKKPTGYHYGTVCVTLAVLMKAGNLVVKTGGVEYFTPNEPDVVKVFENSREFRKASFKAISKKLNTEQKNSIVQTLQDIKYNEQIKSDNDPRIDWNANDFHLVQATANAVNHLITEIRSIEQTQSDYRKLFPTLSTAVEDLSRLAGVPNENNYIDKAAKFIEFGSKVTGVSNEINAIKKFIRNNLDKAREMNQFVNRLEGELEKARVSESLFNDHIKKFKLLYKDNLVNNYQELNRVAQTIKDIYYEHMTQENKKLREVSKRVQDKGKKVLKEIQNYPEGLNRDIIQRATEIIENAAKKNVKEVKLEYDIACHNSNLTLSEMQSYILLAPSIEQELELLLTKIKTDDKKKKDIKSIRLQLRLGEGKIKVGEYRILLNEQIKQIESLRSNDEIEIEIVKN